MNISKNQMQSSDAISKAKAALIIDRPFFATMLLGMDFILDESIPTMATDGEKILFNPDFTVSLTALELQFVLAHEVLHCVFDHMGRRESRDALKWNIAADYCINEILVSDGIGSMPKGALYDTALTARAGNTAEGVYAALPENPKGSDSYPSAGQQGGPLDSVLDSGKDTAEIAAKSAQLKVRIIQAGTTARAQGKLGAGLERLIGEIVKPKVDWKNALRKFLSEKSKTDFTYARPKRRFLGEDLYLPSSSGEKLGRISVAIDCSGSINDEMLSIFGSEIKAICADTAPSEVEIIYFDSKICHIDIFAQGEEIELRPYGGGGTDFAPIMEHIENAEIPSTALVVLTDLCGPFGRIVPSCPIIWAAFNAMGAVAPYGETLEVISHD